MHWKFRWMNDYSKCFSPQLRAQESQSCVQLVLSPPCQVWPARLAVSPAPLGFTAEEQDSGLQLDPAARVSPYTVLDSLLCSNLISILSHGTVSLVTLIGYWCPPGQTVATALPCPLGHFCSQGSASPEPCPSGTYQDREKQAACSVCEAGGSLSAEAYIYFPFWKHLI